jgi:hypothetical protein
MRVRQVRLNRNFRAGDSMKKQDQDSIRIFFLRYIEKNEPKAQPGQNKGLTVMMDSHADWLRSSSVDEDFNGFVAYVASGNTFPLTTKKGFRLKPGHENMVAIKAVDVITDAKTIHIDPELRNCLFHDEIELKLHKEYSQVHLLKSD